MRPGRRQGWQVRRLAPVGYRLGEGDQVFGEAFKKFARSLMKTRI